MANDKLKIIYVYDALCGWCYAFSKVMTKLYALHHEEFYFDVISGGMILGDRVGPISESSDIIKEHLPRLEETSGVKFGAGYLKVLEKGEQIQDSEKPSIALTVFRSFLPDQAILFAADLQTTKYQDGTDLALDESYFPLLEKYGIDQNLFLEKLQSEEFKQLAYYDFAIAKQLQVSGYPAAFIQAGDQEFYMIAKGYADFETMELRIKNVKQQIGR